MFFTLDSQDNVLTAPLNGFLLSWILIHILLSLMSGLAFVLLYLMQLVPWLIGYFDVDAVFISIPWGVFYSNSFPVRVIIASSLVMNSIVFGVILGFVQKQMLGHRTTEPVAWWRMSVLGWPTGMLLAYIGTIVVDMGYSAYLGGLLLLFLTGTVMSKLGQSYLLRIKLIRSHWWTIVSILSWTSASACVTPFWPSFIISDGIAGGIAGLITGIVLIPVLKLPDSLT